MSEAYDIQLNEKQTPSVDGGSATGSFQPPQMGIWQRRLTVVSLCLTLFLGALDTTIIATALPSISNQLRITSAEYR
ncbi:major facilitator superfamily domain-containing protein [Penicillium malachiteum]|nr:major facilitator superfamily domain-containing protein [Penicillium malachiteum]